MYYICINSATKSDKDEIRTIEKTKTDEILERISIKLDQIWSRLKPNSPMWIHFVIGIAMMASRSLTIFSLVYINYPTQVVFKSMKLLSVLIGSVFCFSKEYSGLEVIGHVSMVISAFCFTLADAEVSDKSDISQETDDIESEYNSTTSKFTFYGIVLVSLSLVADSVHANYQEYALKVKKSTMSELMIFSNFIAAVISSAACIFSQEWIDTTYFVRKHPEIMYLIFFRSVCIFFGAVAYLALTKRFGAVIASEVTTARKVVTIITSFIFFPKPFMFKHQIGSLLFGLSVVLNVYAKRSAEASKPKNSIDIEVDENEPLTDDSAD